MSYVNNFNSFSAYSENMLNKTWHKLCAQRFYLFYFRDIEAEHIMERNVTGKLNLLKIYLIPVIAICLLASGLISETCVWGDLCSDGLQLSEKSGESYPVHFRCSTALCKICTLEHGLSDKAYSSHHTSSNNRTILDSSLNSFNSLFYYINTIAKVFSFRIFPFIKLHAIPTYLKNLSFLL
jgi:hypothetical protein